MSIRMIPAMMVASCRPLTPNFAVIPARITMKAPVGPAICRRLPPKMDTAAPATIAVYSPCSGLTPEAIANAMAKGSATTPTMIPATRFGSQFLIRSNPACFASSIAIITTSNTNTINIW